MERFELSADEAIKLMEERHEDYKVELIHKHDDKGEKAFILQAGVISLTFVQVRT